MSLRSVLSRLFSTKRPFKLTKPGWIFILYTIGVGAGAINTGNNLLYLVFGVFLGLLLASGLLSDLSLWGVDVDPIFPYAVQAGQPVSIFLNITNQKKWLPSLSVKVSVEGVLREVPLALKRHLVFLSAHSLHQTRVEWTPSSRGWFKLDNIRLSTRFPFGLLEKWWQLHWEKTSEEGFFVTPKIYPVDFNQLPLAMAGEDKTSEQFDRGDGTTLIGVHSFVQGDNPRRIHWKASAKRSPVFAGDSSGWLVREMNKDEREEIFFVCPEPADVIGLSDGEVDRFASFLASALVACEQSGYQPRLVLAMALVVDESAVLAMWDPRKSMDPLLVPALGRAVIPDQIRSHLSLNVLEAFRVSHLS